MATEKETIDWHLLAQAEVLQRLGASEDGFTSEQAAARLAEHGPNELPQKPPPPFWLVFLRQFHSPLIYILAVAAVISIVVGEYIDAGFIGAVLLLNAIIGSYQEWKAERASHALQKLIVTQAAVVRDGETEDIPARDLVPGDIVWIESGNRLPADLRLLFTSHLQVDESLLTGESLPVRKDADWEPRKGATLGDRLNLCHAGSVVAHGRGRGVVVSTGRDTTVGQLARDVTSRSGGKPPLMMRLERFTKVVGIVVLAAALLVAVLGVVVRGESVHEMFLVGVALAVSAIPEGLPVTLTVVLAIATHRMARRGVVVRRLAAVEGLGSCTLIASDKTGTLTCNELTVQHAMLPDGTGLDVSGVGYAPVGDVRRHKTVLHADDDKPLAELARACVLCNEGSLHRAREEWHWHGDSTDIALLAFGAKAGVRREALESRYPLLNQIPFEPERKYAATFHRDGESALVCVKGAPERVLSMCSLDDGSDHERLLQLATELASRGYRVLGVAEGTEPLPGKDTPTEPQRLRFLGFVGMIDPLRDGVKGAVAACRKAGIGVSMVTGDHPLTALAISRELGLADDDSQLVTGAELEKLSDDQLQARIRDTRVFARTSPQQKLQIVNAARAAKEFVAVTGDGVNDAPALRAANIGVAMGKSGTDVAREAAELVISDDNFATIVSGVEEGRIAYDNLRKVIFLLVSTGAAEVLMVLLAVGLGYPLPLAPVQLLWLNLVTNGIQDKALAFEPGEGAELSRPPRPTQERIFNQLMIERLLLAALVMGGVGFALFVSLLPEADSAGKYAPAAVYSASNIVLLLFVVFENLHVFNSRSETHMIYELSPFRNPLLVWCVAGAFLVHLGAMYFEPMRKVLGTEPVGLDVWAMVFLLALALPLALELHKLMRRRLTSQKQGREA